jgi:hypothetical protein
MQRSSTVLRFAAVAIASITGSNILLAASQGLCQLNSAGGKIQHVIYIQFDNVHLTRDNPNLPSDLEQMPHLLNFIKQNGALDAGFSLSASETLGAVATMQEAGIPITIYYIADAHDDHVNDVAFGPGEAGYVAQLKTYDAGFEKFFARLKDDGIDQTNTLFVITADEGDHFAGGAPVPANCDGVNTPCTYPQIGELDVNLNGLVLNQTGNGTNFSIHFDMAPTVSIIGNPSFTRTIARKLEQDSSSLNLFNPYTNQNEHVAAAMADPVEMGLLHMITADPARTPTFTMFCQPDYFSCPVARSYPHRTRVLRGTTEEFSRKSLRRFLAL